jgi:hypothetical protein
MQAAISVAMDNPEGVTVTLNHFSAKAAGEGRSSCPVTGGFFSAAGGGNLALTMPPG